MKKRYALSMGPDQIGRFRFLTLAIPLRPFLEGLAGIRMLTDMFFLGIFLSGIYAVRGEKYRYRLALLLAGAGFSARIAYRFHGVPVLELQLRHPDLPRLR